MADYLSERQVTMSKPVVYQNVEKTHSKEDGLTGSQTASCLLSAGIGFIFERPQDEYTASLVHPDGTTTSATGRTEVEAVASAHSQNNKS